VVSCVAAAATATAVAAVQLVLEELQELPSSSPLDGSLQNWWNMFDAFTISRIDDRVAEMPEISDDDYERVSLSASWMRLER